MPFDGIGYDGRIEALDKMDKVIDLLAREDRWCKQQLRSYDGRRCILGAMMAADATVALKEPILLAIKQVSGRDFLRSEMFNDHPLTTHAMVLRVLHQARENIIARATQAPAALTPSATRPRWSGALKSWERLRRVFA